MNKKEANVLLFIITFFAAVQYAFLSGVPDSVSSFAFLFITNLIGFLITFALFFSELFRLDRKNLKQSFILSVELFAFNFFVLLGSSGIESTVTACVLSSYFVFIPVLSFILYRQKPEKNVVVGILLVLGGLYFMMNCNLQGLLQSNILFLVAADFFFAVYILTTGKYSSDSNPSLLAMGQLFFNFLISLACWAVEAALGKTAFSLPSDPAFWGSVIFISFFIRSLYGITQIFAQRYVSPLNTSLIFSTEIIMTMLASPLLTALFGLDAEEENITVYRIIGAVIMLLGILISDSSVINGIKLKLSGQNHVKKRKKADGYYEHSVRMSILVICAVVYLVLDLPVQLSGFLKFGSYVGIKSFLPASLGLLFGVYGIMGELLGCGIAGLILSTPINELLLEFICIIFTGLCMWLLWHLGSNTHKVHFKRPIHFLKFLGILVLSYTVCGLISSFLIPGGSFASVFLSGVSLSFLVGIPVITILNGILCIEPITPPISPKKGGEVCHLNSDISTLEHCNGILASSAKDYGVGSGKLLVIQSCVEELYLRIIHIQPDAEIDVKLNMSGMFSAEMSYYGPRINPLLITVDDDETQKAGLKLLKYRTLQSSYYRKSGNNVVFVLINDGIVGQLNSSTDSLSIFNETLEEYSAGKHVPKKNVYQLQNCIEELYIRILKTIPDASITISVTYDDSYSAKLIYSGKGYNPLYFRKNEDEFDIISLKLVKHLALRAGYSYWFGENRLHIVI